MASTLPPLKMRRVTADLESEVKATLGRSEVLVVVDLAGEVAHLKRLYRRERCILDLEGLSTVYSDDYYERNVAGKTIAFANITSESLIIAEASDQLRKFLRWGMVVVLEVTSRQAALMGL